MKPLTIELPYLMPGLNGKSGLMRQHFQAAKRAKDALIWEIRQQRSGPAIKHPVRVVYTRYTSSLMDWDNACASFKHIGDALIAAGVIEDDSPQIIAEFIPRQVKAKRAEQKTVIEIENLTP